MAQPGNCNGYFILKFPDGWGCAPTWNHQMRNSESAAMSLHNACTIQCNAMVAQCLYNVMQWLHRGQDLAQYCDSKGARHGRTCGACGACGAWIKESQRVSFELCVEEEESLCGGGRISQRGWSIIADAPPCTQWVVWHPKIWWTDFVKFGLFGACCSFNKRTKQKSHVCREQSL